MSETPMTYTPEKMVLPDSWTGEMRALLVIGIPMAFAQFIQFFVFFIDVVMIGRIGPEFLAASGLGAVIYFALWMLCSGPVSAVSPLISQALGADVKNRRDARHSVRMVVWLIFMIFPVLCLVLFLTEPLALALGQDPLVSKLAGQYVLALAPGLPFALAVMALRNFLAALEKTAIPLVLVALTTALNGVLNYVFIFGHFGVPRLELIGAGIASSLSYVISFVFFVLYIKWDKYAASFDIFKNFWRPNWTRLKEAVHLGWPISITTFFEGMLFNACVILMGLIGVLEQAAYQIALNLAALAFMLPFGLSMAGAVRIGLAEGARNRGARSRAASTTLLASVLAIGIAAIPVALLPETMASIYIRIDKPENAQVLAIVVSFLPIAAAFMLFDAAQVAANQLLRGLKDVRWPMIITGISYWLVGFPTAYYLGLHTDVGARGIWYGLMVSLIVAAIGLGWRLSNRLGKPL